MGGEFNVRTIQTDATALTKKKRVKKKQRGKVPNGPTTENPQEDPKKKEQGRKERMCLATESRKTQTGKELKGGGGPIDYNH